MGITIYKWFKLWSSFTIIIYSLNPFSSLFTSHPNVCMSFFLSFFYNHIELIQRLSISVLLKITNFIFIFCYQHLLDWDIEVWDAQYFSFYVVAHRDPTCSIYVRYTRLCEALFLISMLSGSGCLAIRILELHLLTLHIRGELIANYTSVSLHIAHNEHALCGQ